MLDTQEIGKVIRGVRKQRGLRLEDLADENISTATISNIERGVSHVKPERAMYLLEKLDLELKELPELIMGGKKKFEEDLYYLKSADIKREIGDIQGALEKLDSLQLGDDHLLTPMLFYLKGKCDKDLQNFKRAKRNLYKAIQLAGQQSDHTNIEAVSFLELSICEYFQNDLDSALKFVESGIDAFQHDGERQDAWYLLQANKGLYLERIGRVGSAMKVVEDNWADLSKMENVQVKLVFYWLRSELNYRLEMDEEALRYAMEGLELARINREFSSIYSLSTVLGSVCLRKGELDQAEESFMNALGCIHKLESKESMANIHIRLGSLYKLKDKHNQAAQALEKAIQTGKEYNDMPRLTSAYIAMGELLQFKGQQQEAVEYFNEALHLATKHNLKKREHRAFITVYENLMANMDPKVP